MSIRIEIEEIRNGRTINNIEQLSLPLKLLVLDLKDEILENFGYTPTVLESLILLSDNDNPHKCKNENCQNIGKFNVKTKSYQYCSRTCSDTDKNRNQKIQQLRQGKIDYHEMNLKSAKTRGEYIDSISGLNGHQLVGQIAVSKRELKYDWSKLTKDNQAKVSKEERLSRIEKRQNTIEQKYGVSHFGGGISRLKNVEICGYNFKIQGYEDIAIFKLIESGINPDDIIIINQNKEFAIDYEFDNKCHKYYPDLKVVSQNRFIEVKSDYWWNFELERNIAKIESAKSKQILIDVIIYDNGDKNEIKRIRKNIKRITKKEV